MRRHKIEVLAVAAIAARGARSADRLRERALHRLRSARDGGLAVLVPAVLAAPVPPHGAATHRAGSSTPSSVLTLRRSGPREDVSLVSAGARPVLLATLDVPFARGRDRVRGRLGRRERTAARRRERRARSCPRTGASSGTATSRARISSDELRKPAELAHSLAVHVERLRVCSPHPVDALLELVAERRPGRARLRAGPVAACGAGRTSAPPSGSASGPAASSGFRRTDLVRVLSRHCTQHRW